MRTWIERSRFLAFLLVKRNEKWYISFCHDCQRREALKQEKPTVAAVRDTGCAGPLV